MTSDFKLDEAEPDFVSVNGVVKIGERTNVVRKILNGFRRQGNKVTPDRGSWGTEAPGDDIVELLVDEDEKREHRSRKLSAPLLAGTAYCISSCSMIVLNKVVLSSYSFNAGISLMFYQNLLSTVIVVLLHFFGLVSLERLNWKLVRVWIPVNVIFVGMLVSGMYSLNYINIAMVTILKNMTNIITAVGEYFIFRKHQNRKVWIAMFLMIISAVSGGITDLSFDAVGYAWQIINCILTAGYSLTLRRVMDTAKHSTKSGSLNEISMVLLNNMLSLPFAIILILMFNEWEYVINSDVISLHMFWVVATLSGVLGLAISFTSMWFLKETGPTTYSLVGSLNKIPISIAGLVLFNVRVSLENLFSILFGLFAGVFFARAKMS
ncbi:GDP-mannose transporter GONST2-like [Rhododendron vialii]|uniref:GDP-mannose transporter GONST2-like n=1 Tax=Rhododendron vialii TaxID=182163 RepID=UPI00265E7379|nr:GDP-mannose transporter GONST2-like [Rhododendron vialii]XP_058198876.1 GDP-mannose transporter GONST2-like [Rhododendron vialii]XP_058198877.1 GDP-mannose transporter GONST2-like [Rhododendron vialii]